MTRRRLSPKQRAALFVTHKGICHMCCEPINEAFQLWEVSHPHPLALGGKDDDSNRAPAHKSCHRTRTFGTKATTAGSDIHAIAKTKRLAKGKQPSGYRWPSRKMHSRPFSAAPRPFNRSKPAPKPSSVMGDRA